MSFDYDSVSETTVSDLDKQIADLKARRKLLKNQEFAAISNLEDKLAVLAGVLNIPDSIDDQDLSSLFDQIVKKAREVMARPSPRPPTYRGGAIRTPDPFDPVPINSLAEQRDGASSYDR